ncbi:WD40 repeat domain-containing protein [Anaerolineales bacterium HSG24]|nr:WD40 repeat domain-containing protein [Anaerolineales bacterium HSG24]
MADEIIKSGDFEERVEYQTIPVNNCTNRGTVAQTVERQRTLEQSVSIDFTGGGGISGGANAGLTADLTIAIGMAYGLQKGISVTDGGSLEFTVDSGEFPTYHIAWKESWEKGYVLGRKEGKTDKIAYDYWYLKSAQPELMETTYTNCNTVASSPESIESPEPIKEELVKEPTNTPIPSITNQPITIGNVNQMVQLNRFGRGFIKDIALSPDGKVLAVASAIGIWIYDISEFEFEDILFIETDFVVYNIAFSPDGRIIASTGPKNTVNLWQVSDGHLLNSLQGHKAWIRDITFSPDGAIVASGSDDYTMRLWRVSDGYLLNTLKNDYKIKSIDFSPNGNTMASGSVNNIVKLWNVLDGNISDDITHLDSSVYDVSVTFSPDGKTLLSATRVQGKVEIWEVSSKKLIDTFYAKQVKSATFSPDGTIIAFDDDKNIQLLHVSNGEIFTSFEGHTSYVDKVIFSPDGNTIISSDEESVRLWQVSDGTLLNTLDHHMDSVYSIVFSPDGKILTIGGRGNQVSLWQIADGKKQTSFYHNGIVENMVLSPNGEIIALDSGDDIQLLSASNLTWLDTLQGHTAGVAALAFSPDGAILASGGFDDTVRLWQVTDSTILKTFDKHTNNVFGVAFSPDGKTIASSSTDDIINLWRVSDGSLLHTLEEHTDYASTLAFSPNGNILASGGQDDTIRLWRISNGDLLTTIENPKGEINNTASGNVNSIVFSSDGSIIASGNNDNTIRLWQASDGNLLNTLNGHISKVNSVAFSPNGDIIASGSSDGTVRLWGIKQ